MLSSGVGEEDSLFGCRGVESLLENIGFPIKDYFLNFSLACYNFMGPISYVSVPALMFTTLKGFAITSSTETLLCLYFLLGSLTCKHICECPGNYCVFTMVMVF